MIRGNVEITRCKHYHCRVSVA